MSKLRQKTVSLYNECIIFSIIVAIFVLISSLFIGCSLYYSHKKSRLYINNNEAEIIENIFSEALTETYHYMNFLGEKIIKYGSEDSNLITNILKNSYIAYKNIDNNYSWALFDWISPDRKVIVNSLYGKLSAPHRLLNCSYLNKAEANPWNFIFDKPCIGFLSKQLVLPTSIGISYENGKLGGFILVALSVQKLMYKINLSLKDKIIFFVLDEHFHYMFGSNIFKDEEEKKYALSQIQNRVIRLNEPGQLKKPVLYKEDLDFTYYKKSDQYNYYIIIGENKYIIFREIYNKFLTHISVLLILATFSIILFFILQYKIMKPMAQLSRTASSIANQERIDIKDYKYKELNALATQLYNIQTLREQLLRSNQRSEFINNEISRINKNLSKRTIELEEALQIKNEFLNNLSHEVRTPIQGVTTLSE
ncbi:two component system sensor kinase SsrA [Rickettsiales bacterium Ac37b]|nr:two component system sensor kinase SsrA [Rickettsiales bacterium Ac37b]